MKHRRVYFVEKCPITQFLVKFLNFFLRGKFGQHFWAGAEGRKMALGRLRAVAVGSFFPKIVL